MLKNIQDKILVKIQSWHVGLLLAFASVLVFVFFLAGPSQREYIRQQQELLPRLELATGMMSRFGQKDAAWHLQGNLLSQDNTELVEIKRSYGRMTASLKRYRTMGGVSAGEMLILDEIETALNKYNKAVDEVQMQSARGLEPQEAVRRLQNEIAPLQGSVEKLRNALLQIFRAQSFSAFANLSMSTSLLVSILSALGITLLVLGMMTLYRALPRGDECALLLAEKIVPGWGGDLVSNAKKADGDGTAEVRDALRQNPGFSLNEISILIEQAVDDLVKAAMTIPETSGDNPGFLSRRNMLLEYIEGLTRQVNLLASTAAVETTLGGRRERLHGLATEVHDLARRSSEASRSALELIGHAEGDPGMWQKIGDEMEQVVLANKRTIAEFKALIGEVSHSSKDASGDIARTLQAIAGGEDAVAPQKEAPAEETRPRGGLFDHDLHRQSQNLAGLLDTLRRLTGYAPPEPEAKKAEDDKTGAGKEHMHRKIQNSVQEIERILDISNRPLLKQIRLDSSLDQAVHGGSTSKDEFQGDFTRDVDYKILN
ncbi:MAG: hypothetical protein OEZ59_00550 [Deltaproteobacteria bacterium]|nr:hypothetical protein [Deltaproteobacteria bacterium]